MLRLLFLFRLSGIAALGHRDLDDVYMFLRYDGSVAC